MINSLFSSIWSICPAHVDSVLKIFETIINAGPVDDAKRSGLKIEKLGKVALVKTIGPMVKNAGWMSWYGLAGTRETQAALISAGSDPDIDKIVWLMDTPGGSVDGLEELANTVDQIKQSKPVIVQVDGLLASAGYYVASQATKIYAAPASLIGSIGTRISLYDYSEMAKNDGIKAIPVDTGVHKSAGMMGTKITDEQIAEFQRIVDGYFEKFLDAVESGRSISRANLKKLADGRMFFASESVENGLIDGEQTMAKTFSSLDVTPTNTRNSRKARAALARANLNKISA